MRRHTTASIGSYITFASGPLKGRTIRAHLEEVQKADLGRKCADPPTSASGGGGSGGAGGAGNGGSGGHGGHSSHTSHGSQSTHHGGHPTMMSGAPIPDGLVRSVRKDRRPLDPPPVVRLRLFEGFNIGTPDEYEKEIPAE